MAKQSGYLQKLAAQQAIRDEKTRRFTLQQCKDMMLITMHEDFGWGRRAAEEAERLLRSDLYELCGNVPRGCKDRQADMVHAGQGGRAPEEGVRKILRTVG